MSTPQEIIDYWIGDAATSPDAAKKRTQLWYMSSAESDDLLREKFGADLARAERGELDSWRQTANGCLALVILLDQFSRNLHRGVAAAFANDPQAVAVAQHAFDKGFDKDMSPIGLSFLIHPFHHAEDIELQNRCVATYEAMIESVSAEWQAQLQGHLDFSREHRDVIAQFSRFPHRNEVLGRHNTAEEQSYLDAGARRYGQ
jgi:uncharacterized protein (DUF924 family)